MNLVCQQKVMGPLTAEQTELFLRNPRCLVLFIMRLCFARVYSRAPITANDQYCEKFGFVMNSLRRVRVRLS
jgi:hypothetical protein